MSGRRDELGMAREAELQENLRYIDSYAEWVKRTPNVEWSKQQKALIDSVLRSARRWKEVVVTW